MTALQAGGLLLLMLAAMAVLCVLVAPLVALEERLGPASVPIWAGLAYIVTVVVLAAWGLSNWPWFVHLLETQ